jgi:hypothetical protein
MPQYIPAGDDCPPFPRFSWHDYTIFTLGSVVA